MDAVRVSALRDRLAGTGWLEAAGAFGGALRRAVGRRGAEPLLLVGTERHEPWHLAAHLDDEAAWSGVPGLAPTLLRHHVPPGAPAHLGHGLTRLATARRGATLLVVAPERTDDPLLERLQDARRSGATLLALDTGDRELAGLAHERLTVPGAGGEPFDLVQHLVSTAAGAKPPGLLARLTAAPLSRW
ncbi:hypothetical protein CFP65_2077 [Kitasatospora sp. MMS16-BH015]|uniref:hypothetical protein n=1 Tax=Kitasatospora sp. MMS16-BH015 TaxID=2018025 RepID=UPI000CA2CDE6|nr:hypothetical protein [Kitasatospora sp. MMS16-BH015]AUG76935.1 hypothetical protein CFP65_2077 [Kitasatospora sp. MMS16-BH015]